jgi:hypothetical protein
MECGVGMGIAWIGRWWRRLREVLVLPAVGAETTPEADAAELALEAERAQRILRLIRQRQGMVADPRPSRPRRAFRLHPDAPLHLRFVQVGIEKVDAWEVVFAPIRDDIETWRTHLYAQFTLAMAARDRDRLRLFDAEFEWFLQRNQANRQ